MVAADQVGQHQAGMIGRRGTNKSPFVFPRPARRVADMDDFNNFVANAIKNIVGIANNEFHPNLGIVRCTSAVRIIPQLPQDRANACHDVAGAPTPPSPAGGGGQGRGACADRRKSAPDPRTPPGCSEPSLFVAFVRFRHDIVGYKFPTVGFGQSPPHRRPFVVGHDKYAGAACFYFASVFHELFLILARPSLGVLQDVFECFGHH